MTRNEFVDKIRIGHNLGNGLECIEPVWRSDCDVKIERGITDINGYHDHRIIIRYPDMTYDCFYSFEEIWSNVPVTQEWFTTLKEHNIQAVRIPINLSSHVVDYNTNEIDTLWLKRIREVIEMCIASGMVAILVLHGDFMLMYRSYNFLSIIDPSRDPSTDAVGRLIAVWKQMAEYVNDIPVEDLAFEIHNEFRCEDLENELTEELKATYVNRFNKHMFDAIRSVGGNATERFLLIGGYGNNPCHGSEILVNSINTELDDKCILTACYYSPWEFTVCNRHSSWEYRGEMRSIMDGFLNEIVSLRDSCGIPIIVTEFGVGASDTDMQDKDKFSICSYIYTVMKNMKNADLPAFIWDPGYILRRDKNEYGIPFWPEMVNHVYNGTEFSLYDSYISAVDDLNFDRLVHRTSKTLEEIQALDNTQTTEA